jgi:hypothetical protein
MNQSTLGQIQQHLMSGKYIYNASFLIKRLRQFNVNVGNATVHIANRKNIKCVYVEGE